MLSEDNVPLDACVSDVVDRCDVADSTMRRRDTSSVVNDRRHSWEETEKYVGTFAVSKSILAENSFD